jgi:hypothetical protein
VSSTAAAVVERINVDEGWRYIYLISLSMAAFSAILMVLRCMARRNSLFKSGPLSKVSSRLRLASAQLIVTAAANVCLQLAMYYGYSEGWSEPKSIALFVTGPILGVAWALLRNKFTTVTAAGETGHSGSPDLPSTCVYLLTFLWGFCYHSFNHLMRKFQSLFWRP